MVFRELPGAAAVMLCLRLMACGKYPATTSHAPTSRNINASLLKIHTP
jgi:hypothetical protein